MVAPNATIAPASPVSAAEQATLVLHAARQEPEVLDLLLCSLSVAASHYRKASVCTPFPRWLSGAEGTRDYQRCATAIQHVPSMQQLAQPEAVASLPSDQVRLAYWLLTSLKAKQVVRPVSLQAFHVHVSARTGRRSSPFIDPYLIPTTVFEMCQGAGGGGVHADCRVSGGGGTVIAYHGTSFENLHSILHNGLMVMSSTKGQRTGALFGDGIYLSTDLPTAFSFCIGQPVPWTGTCLGSLLRCVLVAEVAENNVHTVRDRQQQQQGDGSLPKTYIVASRPSDVRLRYILLYIDRPPPHLHQQMLQRQHLRGGQAGGGFALPGGSRLRQVNWCSVIVAAYCAFMLGLLIWQSTPHRTRRKLVPWAYAAPYN